jgi:hypothetical protein
LVDNGWMETRRRLADHFGPFLPRPLARIG